MYADRRLRKSRETKVRLNELVEALAKREAEKHGMQLAVWVRYILERDLAEKGYEFPCGEDMQMIRSRSACRAEGHE